MPDIWLDETAEGNVFAALRMREADLTKHLTGADEKKDEARTKAREEARLKLEEQLAKQKEPPKPLPEFGTAEDFQLQQALNQLTQAAGDGQQDRHRAQGRDRSQLSPAVATPPRPAACGPCASG